MKDDIVERLRRTDRDWKNPEQALLNEAADEIERLRTALVELVAINEEVGSAADTDAWEARRRISMIVARAAIAKEG